MSLRDPSDIPAPRPLRFELTLTDYSPGGVTAELRLEGGGSSPLGRVTVHPDDIGDVLKAMLRAWLHPGTYQR
jgi:hypothetical protein